MSPYPYQRIADVLKDEIRTEVWMAGGKLPSRAAFANRFGVSEMTISNAIRVLEQDGWLIRHQGKGVFVADPSNRKPDVSLASGVDLHSRVTNVEVGLAEVFARLDSLEKRE